MSTADEGSGMEFGILGPLRVVVRGQERPVPGEKLQGLLARLLLEPNRAVSTERLIDDLWGDEPPATARQSLHVHAARLRRLLAAEDADGSLLVNDRRGYMLRVADEQLDATRFRRLLAAARDERRAGRPAPAAERYREALALWRGPVLDGVPLQRAAGERAELDDLRLAALEERIEADLQLGVAAELVPELEHLVQAEPLRERLWGQLMLALYASGRQADALAAYQNARRELSSLGLEPGPRLRELEQAILRQDPGLLTAPLPAVASGAEAGAASPRRSLLAAAATAAAALVVAAVVLVARDDSPSAAPLAPVVAGPNSLVEIDPASNRVVSAVHVGKQPESIASTNDALWVANVGDRTVARVDLATRQVRIVGGAPVAHQLVGGLNGDVWLSSFEEGVVTLIAHRGRIGDDIRELLGAPVRVELPGSAEGLAVGGGYLWVTSPSDSGGSDTIHRIDLRSRRLVSSVPVGTVPAFVSFGYGSAWVANYRGDSVSVVRPGSEQAETIQVAGGPLGIAAGAGGIWVVAFWPKELVRIDPETRRVLRRIRVGAGPLAVAVGAGAVWVTNRDDRTVSRIDPRTNRVSRTIRLAAAPHGIRFAHGRLWVTTQECGSPVVQC
jgi:YVTN family beta-propeller protein